MRTAFLVSYVLLWLLTAGLVIAVFALYHHFGQMYLNSREGRESQGPAEGAAFQPLATEDISGTARVLPLLEQAALVIFVSVTCPLCAALRAALLRLADSHPHLPTLVICEGHPRLVRAWAGELADVVPVVADPRGRISARYRIDALPFCVAVGDDGAVRARGLVNDYEGLVMAAHEAANVLPVLEAHEHQRGSQR